MIGANAINERNKHACEIYAGFSLRNEMLSDKIRIRNARAIHEIADFLAIPRLSDKMGKRSGNSGNRARSRISGETRIGIRDAAENAD